MKKHLLNYYLCSILFILWGIKTNATQLSGNYTIDSAGTASSTVFKDFTSAITYLTSSNTRSDGGPSNSSPFGVSGPVIFEVMQGTYIGQVDIIAITGTSATNTVTFDGGNGNAATRIIQYTAASTTDAHTLRFNACNYVNIRNLSIQALGASAGIGVHFYGANTFNSMRCCSVVVANTSSTGVKAVAATASNVSSTGGSCSGSAAACNNIYIDSSYISGGYIGIFLSSSSSSSGGPHNFYVRWNRIENAYSTGIGASGSNGYLYLANYIKMFPGSTSSKGIHHCNGSSTGVMSYIITRNIIENAGAYGIHFQSNNSNTNVLYPTMVSNNFIMPTFLSSSAYGMDFSQPRNHKVINNTILMNVANGIGINLSTTSTNANCAVKNNIIELLNPAASNLCINSTALTIDSCDYNVYLKNGTSQSLLNLRGVAYDKSSYLGGGGFNLKSTLDDPMLSSITDPRPRNICQKGDTIWGISRDLFDSIRLMPPQIGCSEPIPGLAVDAAVVKFVQPSSYPFYSGAQDVKVVIKNTASTTLTAVNVTVSLGGANYKTIAWTGSLLSCAVDTVTFTGANQMTFAAGTNVLRAWVDGPNASVDSNASNDTISKTFCTPLATGTYTIDTSGLGNFTSFTQVANILNCGGIIGSGPTIFNVVTGTFVEQFALDQIYGLNVNSPIIFQSVANHPDSVILIYNAGVSNNYTVKLTNTSYIKFKAITLASMNSTYGKVIEMAGLISYDTLIDCKIIGSTLGTTANTSALVFASGIVGHHNVFMNNKFTNGSYGLYLYGSSASSISDSNIIDNNIFTDVYYQSIAVSFVNNIRITKNTIYPSAIYTSPIGIYMTTCNSANFIAGNSVTGMTGGYGIYLVSVTGTAALPTIVKNNMVAGGTFNTFYGMYLSSNSYTYVMNNSVSANSTASTNYACWTQYSSSSTGPTNYLRNNVFANTATNTVITSAALYVYNFLYLNTDYNNLYTAGSTLVNVATPAVSHPNIFSWRNASTFEKNSISYKPGFVSNTNPRPNPMDSCSWSLNGNGIIIAGNNYDFDNNPRSTNIYDGPVDLGAFEFTPLAAPPMATSPASQLAPDSLQTFMFAGDTVATIKWDAGYAVPTSVTVRRYNGNRPVFIDTSATNYMYQYIDVSGTSGYYLFNLNQYYKNEWLGRVAYESLLRMARRDTNATGTWIPFASTSSSVDTVRNVITLDLINDLGYIYTGTDNNNPLPVKLIYFAGVKKQNEVLLNWTTAQEINSASFTIERSFDKNKWEKIGMVKAAGNSKQLKNYHFTDLVNGKGILYYRLKMTDLDGKFEYSKVVIINPDKDNTKDIEVYPNPFDNQLFIALNSFTDQNILVDIKDITGKSVTSQMISFTAGSGMLNLEKVADLKPGVYILSMKVNGNDVVRKIVKQ